jgi:hypothetical protein
VKIKSFLAAHSTLIIFLLFSELFFGSVSQSHAQSSQVWSEPVNLSNSGSAVDPLLVIDSVGGMHVIWVDEIEGYKYTESTDGIVWTTPRTGNFPFSPVDDSRPTFIANRNGSIHFFWRDKDNALYHVQTQSENFGNPAATAVKKIADSTLDFSAKVDSRGALHVSYVTSIGTDVNPPGIYYRRLDSVGWSATVNLYSSQYFRSLNSDSAHVRLAVSSDENTDNIYIVWDDRPQKRVFMAKSVDGGVVWNEAMQVKGPEDSAGIETPFNVDISFNNDEVLLLWQAGSPGERCTQYSQSSMDGGERFGEPIKLLDEFVACPKGSEFIVRNKDFSVVLLNIQDDLSLIAWNKSMWSRLQPQNELSSFPNPSTFDNVIFGCQKLSYYGERLYMVGCDVGNGKDIWFRSRSLGSFEEWFPPPSAWTSPDVVTSAKQKISSLVSVAGNENNIHAFWVQAPLLDIDKADSTIQYSRRRDEKWSKPGSILAGFDGVPVQLSSTIDIQERLFLSWVEGKNGDLYFSWASADRAHVPSEWSEPQQIPTPSQISSSPDILVDDSGKVVIAYSVPLNEGRGVYIVRSDDLGKTWSQPLRVFDAVSANWDLADQPKIGLSGDGRLQLLFSKSSLREADLSGGLYYVQSSDGGTTWSQADVVSEKPILWSRILGFDKQMVHRLWQEDNGVTLDTFHQVSRDGGETWESLVKVASSNDTSIKMTLTRDLEGHLYVAQTHVEDGSLVVEILKWDGFRWTSQDGKEIHIEDDNAQFSTILDVSQKGLLSVMVSITYPDLTNGLENEIINFTRSLELSSKSQTPLPFLIATPAVATALTDSPGVQATPTESSPLANLNDAPASSGKNLVGLLLIGGVIILIIVVIWPRKKRDGG